MSDNVSTENTAAKPSAEPETPTTPSKDVSDTESPPPFNYPGAIHGLVGSGAGVLLAVVSMLVGGMAIGTQNLEAAATWSGWLLFGLALVKCFRAIREGCTWTATVLVITFAWMSVWTLLHARSVYATWITVTESHPGLRAAIIVAALMTTLGMIASVVRLAKGKPADETKRPPVFSMVLGALYCLGMLALPTFLTARMLNNRAERQLSDLRTVLEAKKTLTPELGAAKLLMGVVASPHAFPILLGAPETALVKGQAASHSVELDAIKATGVSAVCIYVSGEGYLPDYPDTDFGGRERLYIQEAREKGLKIVLADVPSAHLTRHPVDWDRFRALHRDRILRYLHEVRPAAYFICTNMLTYHRLGNISTRFDRTSRFTDNTRTKRYIEHFLEMWRDHLGSIAREIKTNRPRTLVGVTVQPWIPEETGIYGHMLEHPDVDILGFECNSVPQLEGCDHLIESRGHPDEKKKRLWIMGTWFGKSPFATHAVSATGDWLSAMVEWSHLNRVDGVFVKPLGAFVPNGDRMALVEGRLAERWEAGGRRISPIGEKWNALVRQAGRSELRASGFDEY